jgi:hypothetical protein
MQETVVGPLLALLVDPELQDGKQTLMGKLVDHWKAMHTSGGPSAFFDGELSPQS